MKHFTFIMMSVLIFSACKKEETSPTQQPHHNETPSVSLSGTSWEGSFDDNFYNYPATLMWNIDFLTDSTGSLHLELVVAGQLQPSIDDSFIYTFNGTEGFYISDKMPESKRFTYESSNNTITIELLIGDGNITLGGLTVFYPENQQPLAFPVNTSWEAEQQFTVCDTVMPVNWGLDFWEYGLGGQINYCAGSTCCGIPLLWQYDSTTHSGFIDVYNVKHPFTYEPETGILTLDYSTTIYGSNITIGGTLQFQHENKLDKKKTMCFKFDSEKIYDIGNSIFCIVQ